MKTLQLLTLTCVVAGSSNLSGASRKQPVTKKDYFVVTPDRFTDEELYADCLRAHAEYQEEKARIETTAPAVERSTAETPDHNADDGTIKKARQESRCWRFLKFLCCATRRKHVRAE